MNRVTIKDGAAISSRVVFDKDVIITDSNTALSSLDAVLSNQAGRINRLESNTKWLYKYGGMGSGGGGGSSEETSFKAQIYDHEFKYLEKDKTVDLNYGKVGTYDFTVRVLKGGEYNYTLRYKYLDAAGQQIIKNEPLKRDAETGKIEQTVYINLQANTNIIFEVEKTDTESLEPEIITFTANVMVVAYTFYLRYVYADDPTEEIEYLNQNIGVNDDLWMQTYKDRGVAIKFHYNVDIQVGTTTQYEFTNWNALSVVKSGDDVDKTEVVYGKIQSKRSQDIILPLVGTNIEDKQKLKEEISNFLKNEENCGQRRFILKIKLEVSGKEVEIDPLILTNTLIPDSLFLKVTNEYKSERQSDPQINTYNYTDKGWVPYTGPDECIEVVGYNDNTYTLPAREGTIIEENGEYFQVINNQWVQLAEQPTIQPVSALSHGINFYIKMAEIGNKIKINEPYYENCAIGGSVLVCELTPIQGEEKSIARRYNLITYVDGWEYVNPLNPTVLIERGKGLDQKQKAYIQLPPNNRTFHTITFKITNVAAPEQSRSQTYYFGVKSMVTFDWYGNKKPVANSFYRYNIASTGVTDSSGNPLQSQNIISKTLNSSDETYRFKNTPAGSSGASAFDQCINIGFQYSELNSNNTPVFTVYCASNDEKIEIYNNKVKIWIKDGTKLVEGESSKDFNLFSIGNDYSVQNAANYHLLTIHIHRETQANRHDVARRSISIYIDGVYDFIFNNFYNFESFFNRITLHRGKYAVNLLECAYFSASSSKVDAINQTYSHNNVLQYYYAYDEKMCGHGFDPETQLEEYRQKIAVYTAFNQLSIDQDGFVCATDTDIMSIAANSQANVIVIDYNDMDTAAKENKGIFSFAEKWNVDNFKNWVKQSYSQDDKSQEANATLDVKVSWSQPYSNPIEIYDPKYPTKTQDFTLKLQGSSTMNYRSKNFELAVVQPSDGAYLYSPNLSVGNTRTFLPEKSFTLKADVVDSSHCNNNVMGDFIIRNLDGFSEIRTEQVKSGVPSSSRLLNHIQPCLYGFPVLVFIKTQYYVKDAIGNPTPTTKYYFFGIYNFNLGRKSYYNLGYNSLLQLNSALSNTTDGSFKVYSLIDTDSLLSGLRVAEIQNNYKYFDFSQFHDTILFNEDGTGDAAGMFADFVDGSQKESTVGSIKSDIRTFVNKIADAGYYVFNELGIKTFIGPQETPTLSDLCCGYNESYTILSSNEFEELIPTNIVPNTAYQVRRSTQAGEEPYAFLPETRHNVLSTLDFSNSLRPLLHGITSEGKKAQLNFKSVSQYYTTCMAFGLVDSVQKNLNIKSWNSDNGNQTFNIAFYDMDTCLGINNNGNRISYSPFSDYWQAEINQSTTPPTIKNSTVYYDFSPKKIPTISANQFDCPSSYLFAIAKYAALIYNRHEIDETVIAYIDDNSPNSTWGAWRTQAGCLSSAQYFIDNYYKNHLNSVPPPAFNYNYRQKYLVPNQPDSAEKAAEAFISDAQNKFWGRKIAYTTWWLNKRCHILDAYFNLQGSVEKIGTKNYTIPRSTILDRNNKDIEVVHDIFSSESTAAYGKSGYITFMAKPFSPIALAVAGSQTTKYVTPDDYIQLQAYFDIYGDSIRATIGGSAQFTKLKNIDLFIDKTATLYINSDYLEEIRCAKWSNTPKDDETRQCTTWNITCPALQYLELTSANYSGNISFEGQTYDSLLSVDISNSGIGFAINGNNFSLTTVKATNKTGGKLLLNSVYNIATLQASGTFNEVYLNCWQQKCVLPTVTNKQFNTAEFHICNPAADGGIGKHFDNATFSMTNNNTVEDIYIDGDFKSVSITNCPSLKTVRFSNFNASVLTSFTLTFPNSSTAPTITVGKLDDMPESGTIDLSYFTSLASVTIQNSKMTELKINSAITIGESGFSSNHSLTKIDPGTVGKITITGHSAFIWCTNFKLTGLYEYNAQGTLIKDRLFISDKLTSLYGIFGYASGLNSDDAKYFLNTVCYRIKDNIVNIAELFRSQENIIYSTSEFISDYRKGKCSLALNFPNCTNANSVFYGTGVRALNKYMFSNLGTNKDAISMAAFITNNYACTTDSLYPVISKMSDYNICYSVPDNYRKTTYNASVYVPRYQLSSDGITRTGISALVYAESANDIVCLSDMFVIRDLSASANSAPSEIDYHYPTNLTSIYGFNVLNTVNAENTFNEHWTCAQANGLTISRFADNATLNVIDCADGTTSLKNMLAGIKIKSINEFISNAKFYDTSLASADHSIDLSAFIGWQQIGSMTNMFLPAEAGAKTSLNFKKHMSYSDFQLAWDTIIEHAGQLTAMSHIFQNAEIRGYYESNPFYLNSQTFRTTHPTTQANIKIINNLFSGLSVLTHENTIQHMSLNHDFMNYLSGITHATNAFYGTRHIHTLPYDFFNKRYYQQKLVYLSSYAEETSEIEYKEATLYTPTYRRELVNLVNCFANIQIRDIAGFDPNADYNTSLSSISGIYIIDISGNIYDHGVYFTGKDPGTISSINQSAITEIRDTQNLSSTYQYAINTTLGEGGKSLTIYNFKLDDYESKFKDRLFIAPDILYGLNTSEAVYIDGIFANTRDPSYSNLNQVTTNFTVNDNTFTGILPQHLLKHFNGNSLANVFKNINAMPQKVCEYTEQIGSGTELQNWQRICYSFVPLNFTKVTKLDNAFNFRIFIPKEKSNENHCSDDFYVLMYQSISNKDNITSMSGCFPNKGCQKLYFSNAEGTKRLETEKYGTTFRYFYIGNMIYQDGNVTSVTPGFNFTSTGFSSLYLDDMFYEYILAITTGPLFESTTDARIENYVKNYTNPESQRLSSNKYLLNICTSSMEEETRKSRFSKSMTCRFSSALTSSVPPRPLKFITDQSNDYTVNIATTTATNYEQIANIYNNANVKVVTWVS